MTEQFFTLNDIELEHIDDVWYQDNMDAETYSEFLAYGDA